MLLIGSKAFIRHYTGLNRIAKDEDFIVTEKDLNGIINVRSYKQVHDCYIVEDGSGRMEFFLAKEDNSWGNYLTYEDAWNTNKVASKETLLSIKKAHIHMPHFRQSKFEKHISDYCILMQDLKEDILLTLTLAHKGHLESLYGVTKTPSLMKSSDKFFNDKVKKVFVHDEIHQIVSHLDKPMYEYFKPDKDIVACDKDLFYKLSQEWRIFSVLEEAYVIALERKIIPMLYLGGEYWPEIGAFKWALRRICTNLTSEFFRDFACANYLNILDKYDSLYVKKFLMAVNSGRIQRIAEKQLSEV